MKICLVMNNWRSRDSEDSEIVQVIGPGVTGEINSEKFTGRLTK